MKTREEMIEFVKSLNQIPWRQADTITPEAEMLVDEHIKKMQKVMGHLNVMESLKPTEAYAEAQSAGFDAPEYKTFMDLLFQMVEFRGAGVREHLILATASYYFWDTDTKIGHLENPWSPLMRLYKMGYTSSFEEDEQKQTIDVIIGYRGGLKSYKLV
jgi:hypothetical protein